jgi:hypothetical protein
MSVLLNFRLILIYSESLSRKKCSFDEILKIFVIWLPKWLFFEIQYLDKETFFSAEIFRIFWVPLSLSMDKNCGRNSVIWFTSKYLKMSRKISKMDITRLQRPMGTNSFRLSLVSRRPVIYLIELFWEYNCIYTSNGRKWFWKLPLKIQDIERIFVIIEFREYFCCFIIISKKSELFDIMTTIIPLLVNLKIKPLFFSSIF